MKKIILILTTVTLAACTTLNPSIEKVREIDLRNTANNSSGSNRIR